MLKLSWDSGMLGIVLGSDCYDDYDSDVLLFLTRVLNSEVFAVASECVARQSAVVLIYACQQICQLLG